MDEKILDDEEAELFGLKRKRPAGAPPAEDAEGMETVETVEVVGMDGSAESADDLAEDLEGVPEEELYARLDEGYTLDGYIDADAVPVDFSDAEEDDESLVMLSPEEAAETVRRREEKARQDKERFEKLFASGSAALDAGDFEKARECFTQANEFDSDDSEMNVGYMRAYSEDFTALDDPDMLSEVYGMCYESAGEAFASRIRSMFGERIAAAKAAAEEEAKGLEEEHEAEQAARGEELAARANRQNGLLLKLGLPFAACALAAVICACFINAVEGSLFVILTAVFGGIALVLLLPVLFTARKAVNIARLQRENEQTSSTQAGRDLLLLRRRIEFLDDCLREGAAEEERA